MNLNFIQNISNSIGFRIASILNLDDDGREIVIYGALNLLQSVWCIFCVIVFGQIFNVLNQTILVCISIAILRKYSGGAHAPSSNSCALVGAVVSVGISLIIKYLLVDISAAALVCIEILSFCIAYYWIYKLAPVDSEAKRITNLNTRKRFKRYSILILKIAVLIIIALNAIYLKYNKIYLFTAGQCISLGILWQAFTLTFTAHKLFNIIDIFKFIKE